MEMKSVENLAVGDVLKNKRNFEFCTLRQIIKADELEQENFEFSGFLARKKVMKKMFESSGNKIFVYNEDLKS
jgi:hypothetical protein